MTSLWQRLRARFGGRASASPSPAPRATEPSARAPSNPPAPRTVALDELVVLDAIGAEVAPPEAEVLATLRRVRGGLREAEALRRTLARGSALSPTVRLACAEMLAARGDTRDALRLVGPLRDPGALLLAADLHASLGDLPRAIGAVERLLARELDAPGARERHTRWRAALGGPARVAPPGAEPTLVAPSQDRVPFRLLREVARGGAGVVYEAEDPGLARKIAFKVHHRRGADRAAVDHEIRATTRLAGPGVVPLLDADPAEGWIAFEWVAHGSLRDRLAAGDGARLVPLTTWVPRLARTLARIHALGFVHGDVKPANVLLRSSGEPLLADFGITRPIGERVEPGSAGYVAPERLAGRSADPHDDVYGFGRVLEDVLARASALGVEVPESARWEGLASLCLDGGDAAPRDGAALVRRVAGAPSTSGR